MTTSESKFQLLLKKRYPGAYIKKIPDFKQTGSPVLRGIPDYLVIHNGMHYWFEVKMAESKYTFNLNKINDYQWIEFKAMLDVDVDVNIAIFDDDWGLHMFKFSDLYKLAKENIMTITINKSRR